MNNLYFNKKTVKKVRDTLTRLKVSGERVRIFYGDAKTGEAWPEENDVIGTIGASCGEKSVPLLVNNSRSMGGCAVLDHCIVAIKYTTGAYLYKHELFTVGEWAIGNDGRFFVSHNGTPHSAFDTEKQARNYISFMKGERGRK